MRKRGVAVLAAVCMLLSACGAKTPVDQESSASPESRAEQGTESGKEEHSNYLKESEWTLKETELPDADAALSDSVFDGAEVEVMSVDWKLVGETIYRTGRVSLPTPEHDGAEWPGWCVQTLEAPYTEWKSYLLPDDAWVEGEKCTGWESYLCGDGSVYMLLQGADSGYIGRWTPEEGCAAVKAESDFLQRSYFSDKSVRTWSTGEEPGYYYILYNDYDFSGFRTIYLDDGFQKKEGLPDVAEGLVYDIVVNPFSGKTYLCGTTATEVTKNERGFSMSAEEGFSIWTEGGKTPVFTTQEVGYSGGVLGDSGVVFSSETEGYLWNANVVWRFSLEDQSIEEIWRTDNMEVMERIPNGSVGLREDGTLLKVGTSYGHGAALWELTENADGGQASDKKVLELADMNPSSFLQDAVAGFNQQSSEYKVVLRVGQKGESLSDFRTRIQAELAAGKGPDLLSGLAVNLDAGARKGYLLDLSEYAASRGDDVLPSAWQLGQVDGKQYAIPYTCQIMTLITSGDIVGDRTGWTRREAMECMENSGADYFMAREDEVGLFRAMGLYSDSNRDFVDWESGKCRLNGEDAVELLEFAEKYADHESTYKDDYRKAADGEILTCRVYLCNYFTMQVVVAMYEGRESYIGFPAEDGEGRHLISGEIFAVNKACPYTEGAMEFLEYLLSDEMQEGIAKVAVESSTSNGFPVQNKALEHFFAYLQEDDRKWLEGLNSYDGFDFQMASLPEESIERLRKVFWTARPLDGRTEEIISFVEEEIGSYLSGSKSAQEMLDIVQNRAQLYMDELQ